MPLVTARDFPGLNPRRDISPITKALGGLFNQQRQQKETQRLEKIQSDKQVLKTTGAQFLGLRNIDNLDTQKTEMSKLARAALQRGEDITIFEEGLKIQDPDEMNLFLTRIATRATDADKILEAELDRQKGSAVGLASAKSEILDDGSTIQVLPDGSVQVTNPLGQIVTGQERADTLQRSQEFKLETQREESKIAVTKAQKIAGAKIRATRVGEVTKEMAQKGREAARSEVKFKSTEKLINLASQGVTGALKLQLAKTFPGIDVTNEGALQASFTDLALDALQRLKGPSTDFEFIKMESIGGAIGDAKSANKARVKSLQRNRFFVSKEAEQFRNHVNAGGDPDEFNFNFGESVTTKKGVFTLRDIQDTALDKNLSIEETIELLNK